MLKTVEAEIHSDCSIRLLEPLRVAKTSRALVTLLETETVPASPKGNAEDVLKFLQENRLPESARTSMEEIEAQISEARESWD